MLSRDRPPWRIAASACEGRQVRHGRPAGCMARPPPHVVVTACVPHARGFPHGAASVSQGGHGTVLKALAHGLPLLCLPLCGDQPAVAARVVIPKEGSLAMAALQPMANQQRSHAGCETKHDMACTTGCRRRVAPRLTQRRGPPADRARGSWSAGRLWPPPHTRRAQWWSRCRPEICPRGGCHHGATRGLSCLCAPGYGGRVCARALSLMTDDIGAQRTTLRGITWPYEADHQLDRSTFARCDQSPAPVKPCPGEK